MFLYPQFMKYSTTIQPKNTKTKGENVLTVKTKDMSCDYLVRVFEFWISCHKITQATDHQQTPKFTSFFQPHECICLT